MSMKRLEPDYEDQPTASVPAEKFVLGAFLNSYDAYWEWSGIVSEDDFTVLLHRRIYRAIRMLAKDNTPLKPDLVAQAMEKGPKGESPPAAYMTAIRHEAREIASLPREIAILQKCTAARDLRTMAEEIVDLASKGDPTVDAARFYELAASIVTKRTRMNSLQKSTKVGDIARRVIDKMQVQIQGTSEKPLSVSLPELHDLIGPMMAGQLIIVAGATGAGKTALMNQMLAEVEAQGHATAMIQAEMDDEEIVLRMLAEQSGIETSKIHAGNVNVGEQEHLVHIAEEMAARAYDIAADTSMTLSGMLARARWLRRQSKVKLLAIDHLRQILPDRSTGGDKFDKFDHIENVVHATKRLARELHIPIILGAQLKRDPSAYDIRTAKDIRNPKPDALYGGSAIEQVADTIVFVHRPHQYLAPVKPAQSSSHYEQWAIDTDRWEGRAKLILTKRRGGKGWGEREVLFDGLRTTFASLSTQAADVSDQEALAFS